MPYNIAMVCDFFFPQPGGVESHIYQLSTKLIDRGHKVIIITHAYKGRTGVRYLTNGLKVYHIPFFVIYRESTMPTVFSFFPLFRNIVIREQIQIVHGHGSMSSLCHEAILHARTMGLRTVFTDHSLFGFADAGSILANKMLKFTLSDVDHVVCVSHTCKENTVLRASLDPLMVSVIPNAVVAENFRPLSHDLRKGDRTSGEIEPRPPPAPIGPNDTITIVVISRLFYNKGTDLLIAVIPRILASHPNVRFIVAGSGPQAIDLEQMLERNVLQDKVELLGSIRHEEVRDVMVRGHIYLHPSLTEAFGTVIVEAASCGLYVVCTRVGGIPEVLPQHMTTFAKPEEDDLVLATEKAIAALRSNKVRTDRFHDQVKMMYSWTDVAQRTERVYKGITGDISPEEFYGYYPGQGWEANADRVRSFALIDRLKRYYGCGVWAGKLFCLCAVIDFLLYVFLEMWFPRSNIDIARSWPKKLGPNGEKSHHLNNRARISQERVAP
ncbi:phosphatidylinositol N-acetylglucosaminyltransferase subunit A/GPI3 [Aspergillus udagawae]|uniref:Phosphatidylinositol N-acetylglucosaminyltransferase GPI3 subunit n=1 Tax=Aspergillus udagawae TaxID=91492 RepID=A0A8E0V1E4_9EURO|nr:phosphatidylinositol N-acetylglucosaminyltransferase gpi3 subunit [Aspergillus udagawae]GIC91423.1 phosphatidylinositol N-acetylglucosaminyltransferase gpi3 subunit [Aspergillus udagawae]